MQTTNERFKIRMLNAGEKGLVVEFGNAIDVGLNRQVQRLGRLLTESSRGEIKETVPTYRSLLIYFEPALITRQQLAERIKSLLAATEADNGSGETARVIKIPVCYGGEYGPDLGFVAEYNRLTMAEVIKIHTATPYLVYMLGFTPGFPYLGGMSEKIATPRLNRPRTAIPAGSVGIAGSQTGFYPVASPGGWQLIGRTPVKAFDPAAEQPFLFAAGDYLHFHSVSPLEYDEIVAEAAEGSYRTEITAISETVTEQAGKQGGNEQ